MKDLRTQEPSHLLSPDQTLPWRQEGPGTPGMEWTSEVAGSWTRSQGDRQEAMEACTSDGCTLQEVASSLIGLLQDAAQAPQPGLVPTSLLSASRGPSSPGVWRGVEGLPGDCRRGPRAPTGPLQRAA